MKDNAGSPVIGITSDMDDDFFKLRHGYVSAVSDAGGLPFVLPPQNRNITEFAGVMDGLLLSGGNDLLTEYYGEEVSVPAECLKFAKKERTDFEMALLAEVIDRQKPVLAICYGMQLVNVFFGGSLFQDIETQIACSTDHRKGHHKIKITGHPALGLSSSGSTVNSSHHQAIKVTGKGLDVFAVSEDGVVEGFLKKDYNFLVGVQWHPERGFVPGADGPELNNYYRLSSDIFGAFIKRAGEKRRS